MRISATFHHEGMTLIGLLKKLKRACQFPVEGIYFLIPGKELSNGLVEIKDDSNLAECIVLAFKNEKLIKIYLEHHGGDDVVIPNRTINDSFLNKLCNGTFISDQTDIPECNEPTDKELLIDGDDEGVDTRYRRNDYQNFMVLCGRAIAEGRCGGKKGKKGVHSPSKKGKGVQIPGKKDKGVQSPGKKGKGVQSPGKKGKGVQSPSKKRKGVQSPGTIKCKLLKAMGRDGNNQMFPIAWVVVNIENNDNWQWFVACLCEDLMLHQGAYLTIISDGHKGAEGSTIQHQFYTKMNLIGNIDLEAKQWLTDRNLNSWCRAFFKMDRGCGAYENGISESYHNSIRIARDTITPSIRKQIEHLKITQRYWTVFPCGDNRYEVRKGDESFGVNIENRTCSSNCTAGDSATAVDESGPTGVDESGQTVVDESGIQMEATVTEDPIQEFENEIPTQTSRTSMKEVVEAFIAAGTLELVGLKRIANRAKAFGKDGAGSSADKAWDVDEEYFELNYVLLVVLSWIV
uniref:60S ribosomal protein L34 n=1 Tax=Tanacetum cinerariifolium TaxID=118510 RepID=A0A699I8F5_TANCI|nr:60S ribosomal protein L34 [Tanacetum cinerariifolium]